MFNNIQINALSVVENWSKLGVWTAVSTPISTPWTAVCLLDIRLGVLNPPLGRKFPNIETIFFNPSISSLTIDKSSFIRSNSFFCNCLSESRCLIQPVTLWTSFFTNSKPCLVSSSTRSISFLLPNNHSNIHFYNKIYFKNLSLRRQSIYFIVDKYD